MQVAKETSIAIAKTSYNVAEERIFRPSAG